MTNVFEPELTGAEDAPTRALEPSDYLEFFSNRIARVDAPNSDSSRVLLSNIPLRDESENGQLEPVDLDLERDGENYRAENPLVDVALPDQLSDPVRLESSQVSIRLAGDEADASKAKVTDEGRLFFHEAAPDIDLVLTPNERGAQILAQIRSALAPGKLHFQVAGVANPDVRLIDGGAIEVRTEGERVALISSPTAVDAQGTEVGSRLEPEGNGFDLIIDHQGADLAYPILVDPVVEDWLYGNTWNWHGSSGIYHWSSFGGYFPTGHLCLSGGGCDASWGSYGGLYIYSIAGWSHPGGAYAGWQYTAPGQTTYIPELHMYPVYWERTTDTQNYSPYISDGLQRPGFGWVDYLTHTGGSYWGHWDTTFSGPDAPTPTYTASQAVFSLAADYGRTPPATRTAMLGGAYIYLEDPEPPTVTLPAAPNPNPWVKSVSQATSSVAPTVSDPGLGVQKVNLYLPDKVEADETREVSHSFSCGGSNSTTLCPASATPQISYPVDQIPDGRSKIQVTAADPQGWESEPKEWEVKVDGSSPKLEFSGTLATAAAGDLTSGTYGLTVKATDGSTESPQDERSGVKEIKVYLDRATNPNPVASQSWTCPEGSCERELTYNLDTSTITAGEHKIEVEVTDQVGNPATVKKLAISKSGYAGVLLSPKAGDTTAQRFFLAAERHDSQMTGATFEFRKPGTGQWAQVPLQNLKLPDGSQPTAYPLALDSNGKTPLVTWDVPPTAGIDGVDGKIKVRARFNGPSGPQPVVAGDPSLYWRLGETEGTTAADSSGNDRTGTYVGGPAMDVDGAPTTGDDDGAVDLDGEGKYVGSTYNPFTNGTARTFAGSAYRDTEDTLDTLLGGTTSDATAPRLYLGGAEGAPASRVIWRVGPGEAVRWDNAWPGTGQWVDWALEFDETANTAELFINGVSKGVRTLATQYPASPGNFNLGIWRVDNSTYHPFDGKLDDVAIYERLLSQPEIQTFNNGIHQGLSQVVPVTLERDTTTSKHASTQLGPGTLDLLTGNYAITADDVSVDSFGSDLTVSRTHSSREPAAEANGPFGPGWIASVPVDAAGSDYVRLTEAGPEGDKTKAIKILASDSTDILFDKDGSGFKVEPMYTGLELTKSGDQYALKDLDGNVTTFVKPSGATEYVPIKVRAPGGQGETLSRFFYENIGGVTRVKAALAPPAYGVNCLNAQNEPAETRGCRWLEFKYSDTTTATGNGSDPNTWGRYTGRLHEVIFHAWGTGSMEARTMATWAYDTDGRLRATWDPRMSPALKTTYAYDSAGKITGTTPPGENPWTLAYTSAPNDANPGRLASVSREVPTSGTALTSVTYNVPLSGSGAPYGMSPSQVDDWGQIDVPTDATAIDPPTSLGKAVYYMNRNGDQVNVASPGGEITTTEYEEHRLVRRGLTAGNRAKALASSDPAGNAQIWDTERVYGADGQELREEFGPQHDVRLANGNTVQARMHMVTTYDEGRPSGGEYHLPTTEAVGARVAGQSTDTDVRVTKTEYDWSLRKPTATIVDPGGLNLVTRTAYDQSNGQIRESRLPKANAQGTDAYTTKTAYWSATGTGACAGRPEWANLPCTEAPGGQPGGSAPPLPTTSFAYNIFNQATTVTETVSGGPTRTTTTTYDNANRPTQVAVSGGQGTAVPATSTTYSSTTGRAVSTSTTEGGTTRTITRGFDAIGRQTSYTDADGQTSTTTYDRLSRPTGTFDGKGTMTIGYDSTTGRPTTMTDSGTGTSQAAYDADGNVIGEWLPNQTYVSAAYNTVGEAVYRGYTKTSCSLNCNLMSFGRWMNIHGQVGWEGTNVGTAAHETQSFEYDAAGRLYETEDWVGAECTQRQYRYDSDSNRRAVRTWAPQPNGSCATGEPQVAEHTYDEADRIIDSGYTYDHYGRTLTVPAADAGGTQLQATYYTDDRVRTLTQGSKTRTFAMDPASRVRVRATNGETDETYHYADDSDNPAWIARPNASGDWERFTSSIGGSLSAIEHGQGTSGNSVTYQLTNLHGDVVAEADSSGNLSAQVFEADEFGVPASTLPSSGYGWLGAKERRSQFDSGVITMGRRLYLPQIGRFLQTDPVSGGSANAYDYAYQDPVNSADLDGNAPIPWNKVAVADAFFAKRGLTRPESAALLGNFMAESGLNPKQAQIGGPARGIAQWEGSRLTGLKAFAGSRGKSWKSFKTQIQYVWYELSTTESHALGKIKRACCTMREKTRAVMKQYERPSIRRFGKRLYYAEKIYRSIQCCSGGRRRR